MQVGDECHHSGPSECAAIVVVRLAFSSDNRTERFDGNTYVKLGGGGTA